MYVVLGKWDVVFIADPGDDSANYQDVVETCAILKQNSGNLMTHARLWLSVQNWHPFVPQTKHYLNPTEK